MERENGGSKNNSELSFEQDFELTMDVNYDDVM